MNNHPTNLYEHFQPPERLTLLIEAMARDDAAEAQRLRRTCPRATYTSEDPQFEDRWAMAFDILAVVMIDLRCMWGKLDVLRWVLGAMRETATTHNINAAFAFLDGERCCRGRKQMGFFARPMPEPGEEVDYGDDAVDDGQEAGDEAGGDEEVLDPPPEEVDRGRRMDAVQKRAEHFTTCSVLSLLGAMKDISKDLVNAWAAYGRFCRTRLGVEPETMMRAWQFPLDDFLGRLNRYDKTRPDPAKVKEYFGYICKQWDRRFRRRRPGDEYITYDDGEGEGGDDNG